MPRATEYFSSLAECARHFEISETAFGKWRRQAGEDFPARETKGYKQDDVEWWAKRHGFGPYREKGKQRTLTEARLELTEEKIRVERAAATTAEIELALQLKQLLLADDVVKLMDRVAATVLTIADAVNDVRDRELPEKCPSKKAWASIRERLLAIDRKMVADISAAMEELTIDG